MLKEEISNVPYCHCFIYHSKCLLIEDCVPLQKALAVVKLQGMA